MLINERIWGEMRASDLIKKMSKKNLIFKGQILIFSNDGVTAH